MRGPASGQAFTFDDALAQLDYLQALGVSHVYLSPILTAAKGSTHGYDVTDPTTVSAELGGADGLARLSARHPRPGHGPGRRHRAQPPRRRRPHAERLVVGPPHARPRVGLRVVLRRRLDAGPARQDRPPRPRRRPRRRRSRGRRRRAAARRPDVADRAGHGIGSAAEVYDRQNYRADRLEAQRVRVPALLLHHVAGGSAPGGPRRVRRHARRGQAVVHRGPRRRPAHRPSGRIVRTPQAISSGCASSPAPTAWIVIEKILAARRGARADPARRGHHRIRRAARDRRPARRPRRRAATANRWRRQIARG